MATIFTHSFFAIILAKSLFKTRQQRKLFTSAMVCSMLPDADVLAFVFGIPYEAFWGHRGFTHSIVFAAITGMAVSSTIFREFKILSREWFIYTIFFFLVTISHGVFDALTDGGLGIAFFSPFDDSRYFFPSTPIDVSPIGLNFFSLYGLKVLWSEFLFVVLPSLSFLSLIYLSRKLR